MSSEPLKRGAYKPCTVAMACEVSQDLEAAVRARAAAESLSMQQAQRAALRAWADGPAGGPQA